MSLRILAAPSDEPEIHPQTDPDRIPYWSVLWDSSRALARWLAEHRRWAGVEGLELGCGAGLAGLAAAALGARVVQTDRFPEAAALARRNARLNGLEPVRHCAADWRMWPLLGRWPVILGADLLYERQSHVPLLRVLERSLAPGGSVYLADPSRPMSAPFFELAAERWSREHCPSAGTITIHRLRRRT